MKAQIRRWSNEEQKNTFVEVDVIEENGNIGINIDNVTITAGHHTVSRALDVAEEIIRRRKISNS